MFAHLHIPLFHTQGHHAQVHWLTICAIAAAVIAAVAAIIIVILLKRRPTALQREERRRKRLAALGRIVDGSLVDVTPAETEPRTLIYRYRIAGVTYECSQDVSTLTPLVKNLRLDYPVQVRYNRQNPADSIVVAETWNGLWTNLWTITNEQPRAR
jgi:heme exporter protein D